MQENADIAVPKYLADGLIWLQPEKPSLFSENYVICFGFFLTASVVNYKNYACKKMHKVLNRIIRIECASEGD